MNISDLSQDIVDIFHQIVVDFDAFFGIPISYLGIGEEEEKIRWIAQEVDADYTDIEKLKKMKWFKVSKAGSLYEYDTNKKYVVTINPQIFYAMSAQERRAFAFYVLSHIGITFSKNGDAKFGLNSSYAADRMTDDHFGNNPLPRPEVLAGRFTDG